MIVINRYKLISTGIVVAAGVSYLTLWPKQYLLPCPIHATTGLWCPGCGSTRAMYALINGDIPLAIHYNAVLLAAPLLAFIGFVLTKVKNKKLLPIYIGALVVLEIVFTILRNLPGSSIAPI